MRRRLDRFAGFVQVGVHFKDANLNVLIPAHVSEALESFENNKFSLLRIIYFLRSVTCSLVD